MGKPLFPGTDRILSDDGACGDADTYGDDGDNGDSYDDVDDDKSEVVLPMPLVCFRHRPTEEDHETYGNTQPGAPCQDHERRGTIVGFFHRFYGPETRVLKIFNWLDKCKLKHCSVANFLFLSREKLQKFEIRVLHRHNPELAQSWLNFWNWQTSLMSLVSKFRRPRLLPLQQT